MKRRRGMLWDGKAEEMLRFTCEEYRQAIIQLANGIALADKRAATTKTDVAYADSILMGELIEAGERRQFLASMEVEYRNSPGHEGLAALFVYYCDQCSRPYKRRDPRAKLCHVCQTGGTPTRKKKTAGESGLYRRVCEMCGVDFLAPMNRFKCRNCKAINKPRGYYVYAWYDGKELIYVGMGREDRAFVVHKLSGLYAPCELRRRKAGGNFRVEIIRDSLTKAGALLIEGTLINHLNPPCNILPGSKKQMMEDLTLEGEDDFRAA